MTEERSTLLTTGQAAKLCSVTPDTVLKWIKKGRIQGTRTAGGHYRIAREEIQSLVAAPCRLAQSPRPAADHSQKLRCWEYLSDRGSVRDDCRQCVVYQVGAARCFLMTGFEAGAGHARQFCENSCDECVYYRGAQGLATNVLVITSDEQLRESLSADENESVKLRFAQNAYEASAVIHDFRPAFAVVDLEDVPAGNRHLLDALAEDARVPGLRVILVVPAGAAARGRRWAKNELVVSVLEKPLGSRPIASLVNGFLEGSLAAQEQLG